MNHTVEEMQSKTLLLQIMSHQTPTCSTVEYRLPFNITCRRATQIAPSTVCSAHFELASVLPLRKCVAWSRKLVWTRMSAIRTASRLHFVSHWFAISLGRVRSRAPPTAGGPFKAAAQCLPPSQVAHHDTQSRYAYTRSQMCTQTTQRILLGSTRWLNEATGKSSLPGPTPN